MPARRRDFFYSGGRSPPHPPQRCSRCSLFASPSRSRRGPLPLPPPCRSLGTLSRRPLADLSRVWWPSVGRFGSLCAPRRSPFSTRGRCCSASSSRCSPRQRRDALARIHSKRCRPPSFRPEPLKKYRSPSLRLEPTQMCRSDPQLPPSARSHSTARVLTPTVTVRRGSSSSPPPPPPASRTRAALAQRSPPPRARARAARGGGGGGGRRRGTCFPPTRRQRRACSWTSPYLPISPHISHISPKAGVQLDVFDQASTVTHQSCSYYF